MAKRVEMPRFVCLYRARRCEGAMPISPASPCSQPGCPNLKPCPRHPSGPFATARRRTNIYASPAWRAARRNFLLLYDRCIECRGPATTVDHEPPHRGDERAFWDQRTWRPMCSSCHNAKTGRETRERARPRG